MVSVILKGHRQEIQQPKAELSLHVFKQDENHRLPTDILVKNGLRQLTYKEALARSCELIEKFGSSPSLGSKNGVSDNLFVDVDNISVRLNIWKMIENSYFVGMV